jgi:hypothetical protein
MLHLPLGGSRWESPASKVERCVISTFQVAESLGFKGDFRQSEHLLRIGD